MLFVLKKECFVSNKFYFQQEVKNEFGASYYYFIINSKKFLQRRIGIPCCPSDRQIKR